MNLRNRVQLIGNLGTNPQVRDFENGKKMARFTVATSDIYKKDGKFVKSTQWHNVIAWGKTAEIAEKNLKIGAEVVIEGCLLNNKFEDREGKTKHISEILAESVMFRNIKNAIESNKLKSSEKRA
jgi:single-strand DNA-binding protein